MAKNTYQLMEERLKGFTPEEYDDAFRFLEREQKITEKQRDMLRIHCEAGTITATRLARAVGYTYRGFNSQYGGLAHLLGERLGLTTVPEVPLRPHHLAGGWLNVLSTPQQQGPEWEFTMRSNVAKALKRMGWCAKSQTRKLSNLAGLGAGPPSAGGGGGFGDAEQNVRVERAAVGAVIRDYRSHGWTVQSKETEKPGYDLLCSRGSVVLHVEVKGISGPDCSFVVTAKEKEKAESDPAFRLVAVTHALRPKRRELSKFTGPELLRKFRFAPVSFMARLR